MATSPLAVRSPNAHRRLFSISIRVLRLAHGVALAFLLRLLLSFLPQLSSLLNPVPIFLLANSLILAIVLSSASSSPSPPDNSSALQSSHSQPIPREQEFGLPQHNKKQSLPNRQHSEASPVVVVSANQFERLPVTLTRSSTFIPVSSLRNSPSELPEKSGVAIAPDPLVELMAIMQNHSNEELKKRLAVKEPAQTKRFMTASTAGDHNMIRSNYGPRKCVGETVETFTNRIQRVDTIDNTPLELCCNGKSSSMIVIHVASFDSIVDDDLNKRCDEFIANSREKWKKECVEYAENMARARPSYEQHRRQGRQSKR